MKTSIHILLSEISPLLKEASEVMRATSETHLASRLDEAAVAIEELAHSGSNDRSVIIETFEIIGRCVVLVPEIAELLRLLKS